ncbi:hypothetical protein [Haloarcula argentinensis]|uniref:Glycosyltransferase RgtA/B/C/D-like domain-containing protein n=2 Tax=Haloarcula argentinensis TaxID=43776 RepID=A0ABU2F2H2_HALAR|nr:hypothetical protein [Haloarcula argentinensis]MDS0254697.1 hypothetical protein [Haloarcula argentinensis]
MQELLALFVIISGLLIWAFRLAQSPLPELTGDPHNIMQRSMTVAQTGNIFATVDPPFRYIPVATLFELFGITTVGDQAAYITHLYSTTTTYVIIPATLYLLVRLTVGRKTALLTLLGVVSWRVFGIGLNAYVDGYWMYDYTIPLIFLTIYFGHKCVSGQSPRSSVKLAVGTGIGIGSVGLNEYILGAYTAAIITVLFIYHRKYLELATSGTIGSLMASSLIFMTDYAKDFILSSGGNRLELLPVSLVVPNAISILTTPAYLFPVFLTFLAVLLYYWNQSTPTDTNVLVISCSVLAVAWLSQFILATGWFALLAQYTGQYLVLTLLMHQMVKGAELFNII